MHGETVKNDIPLICLQCYFWQVSTCIRPTTGKSFICKMTNGCSLYVCMSHKMLLTHLHDYELKLALRTDKLVAGKRLYTLKVQDS